MGLFCAGQPRHRRMPDAGVPRGSSSLCRGAELFDQPARSQCQSACRGRRQFRRLLGNQVGSRRARAIAAVVNWGGGIHKFFQPEWQERSRNADSYLFDLIEARANLFGKKTFEELCQAMPALSLLDQGWLDKPCAPMLLVNGKEDKQVPPEDFYLLLERGNPKTIRLFLGGHMGNIPFVFETVIPWLHKRLET